MDLDFGDAMTGLGAICARVGWMASKRTRKRRCDALGQVGAPSCDRRREGSPFHPPRTRRNR